MTRRLLRELAVKCSTQISLLFLVIKGEGGLALLCKDDFVLDVLTSSDNHIDGVVDQGMDDTWRFIGFYGDPNTTSRENYWNLLRDLSQRPNLPWVCMGEFNEILKLEEKHGWLVRPKR